MIIFGIILAILTVYLLTGVATARLMRSAIIAKNIIAKGELVYRLKPGYEFFHEWVPSRGEIKRDRVREQTRTMIFGWPVYLPMFAINHSLDQAMDRVDPLVHAKLAGRIAELEKELFEEAS